MIVSATLQTLSIYMNPAKVPRDMEDLLLDTKTNSKTLLTLRTFDYYLRLDYERFIEMIKNNSSLENLILVEYRKWPKALDGIRGNPNSRIESVVSGWMRNSYTSLIQRESTKLLFFSDCESVLMIMCEALIEKLFPGVG
ncbi:hypothetical protein HK098_000072 [Nowakowskiella sp. JEL0407]|nr:hypothetical protein HK098_000072 [Nowakowskiella sp. JEL0407]